MITILDPKGMMHLIPRERLISIGMTERDEADSPDVKVRLVITYDTSSEAVGQCIFCFTNVEAKEYLKTLLTTWAEKESPNRLHINSGSDTVVSPDTLPIHL